MDLDQVADELYGLAPSEFVPRRNALVADARKSGEKDLADLLKKLRRPTVGAWLVNLLAREREQVVQRLADLGDEMRSAQRNLAGDELRKLSKQRQSLISELTRDAKKIAPSHGQPVTDAALQELTSTLDAALADAKAADEVKRGRLTSGLRYSGFGEIDLSDPPVRPVSTKNATHDPEKKEVKATPDARRAGTDRLDAARRLLKESEEARAAQQRDVRTKESAVEKAGDECGRLGDRVDELDKQLSKLREAKRKAESAKIAAQKDLDKARLRLNEAEKAAAKASASLGRISR
jgi:hypothetical protein